MITLIENMGIRIINVFRPMFGLNPLPLIKTPMTKGKEEGNLASGPYGVGARIHMQSNMMMDIYEKDAQARS